MHPEDDLWSKNVEEIKVTQYTSAQYILFLSKATCFDLKLVIFRHLQYFSLPDALPTLGSHIVFTVVEYI